MAPLVSAARNSEPSESELPDYDQEGQMENCDECPLAFENYNGFRDDDGCPDVLPERSCPYSISPQVFFSRSRSAVVGKDGFRTIRRAAEMFFVVPPGYTLEIRGHAARGEMVDEDASVRLGERRARSVRDAMIRKFRVPPARVMTRSMGTREPYPCGVGNIDERDRRVDFALVPTEPR